MISLVVSAFALAASVISLWVSTLVYRQARDNARRAGLL
jgi:hypothetical protein